VKILVCASAALVLSACDTTSGGHEASEDLNAAFGVSSYNLTTTENEVNVEYLAEDGTVLGTLQAYNKPGDRQLILNMNGMVLTHGGIESDLDPGTPEQLFLPVKEHSMTVGSIPAGGLLFLEGPIQAALAGITINFTMMEDPFAGVAFDDGKPQDVYNSGGNWGCGETGGLGCYGSYYYGRHQSDYWYASYREIFGQYCWGLAGMCNGGNAGCSDTWAMCDWHCTVSAGPSGCSTYNYYIGSGCTGNEGCMGTYRTYYDCGAGSCQSDHDYAGF
jgi:hypothetical protein